MVPRFPPRPQWPRANGLPFDFSLQLSGPLTSAFGTSSFTLGTAANWSFNRLLCAAPRTATEADFLAYLPLVTRLQRVHVVQDRSRDQRGDQRGLRQHQPHGPGSRADSCSGTGHADAARRRPGERRRAPISPSIGDRSGHLGPLLRERTADQSAAACATSASRSWCGGPPAHSRFLKIVVSTALDSGRLHSHRQLLSRVN